MCPRHAVYGVRHADDGPTWYVYVMPAHVNPRPAAAAARPAARPVGTVFTRSTGTVHAIRPWTPGHPTDITVCGRDAIAMASVPADPWTRAALVGPSCARCGYPVPAAPAVDAAPAPAVPAPRARDTYADGVPVDAVHAATMARVRALRTFGAITHDDAAMIVRTVSADTDTLRTRYRPAVPAPAHVR